VIVGIVSIRVFRIFQVPVAHTSPASAQVEGATHPAPSQWWWALGMGTVVGALGMGTWCWGPWGWGPWFRRVGRGWQGWQLYLL